MQIIDGYCNEPNIFADDIGEYNTAIWGTRDCVLPAGERLGYELVSNNEIKIKDGVFSTQGRRGVIKKGATESCIIENGTQAENRNDLIVIEYAKDSSTLVESHTLKVIKGTPGEAATDPDVVTGDIQAGATYMICSDGFRHKISNDEIMSKIGPAACGTEAEMEDGCKFLTELVKYRKETDNITVVLIKTE